MGEKKDYQLEMETKGNIIAQDIRHSIETGKYKSGDKIKEVDLCRQYGVSRTPVREVFRLLEKEGLLVHTPQYGVQVANFGYLEMISSQEVRISLECLSVRKAAVKATKEQIDVLRDINNQIALYDEKDPRKTNLLDEKFHLTISRIGDNTYVAEFLENILLKHRITTYLLPFKKERIPHTYKEHEDIITALEHQDPVLAEKYMEIHFHNSTLSILKKLQDYLDKQKI